MGVGRHAKRASARRATETGTGFLGDQSSQSLGVVLCAGVQGSASTWVFNVTIEIFRKAYPLGRTIPFFTNAAAELAAAGIGADYLVIKTHRPVLAMLEQERFGTIAVIASTRDPRDGVASLMSRFGMDFNKALHRVTLSANAMVPILAMPGILHLRYEDGFCFDFGTIEVIARHLGVHLGEEDRRAIFASFTAEQVRARIADLAAQGRFAQLPAADTWDEDSQWHPAHVGDGRAGKWREVLSSDQAARVELACAGF